MAVDGLTLSAITVSSLLPKVKRRLENTTKWGYEVVRNPKPGLLELWAAPHLRLGPPTDNNRT